MHVSSYNLDDLFWDVVVLLAVNPFLHRVAFGLRAL